MKKSIIIIVTIIILLGLSIYSGVILNSEEYHLSIHAKVISNNGKELVIKGISQNPYGQREQYRVENHSNLLIYDVDKNEMGFSDLTANAILYITYDWTIAKKSFKNFEEKLELKPNQKIPDVTSISIISP